MRDFATVRAAPRAMRRRLRGREARGELSHEPFDPGGGTGEIDPFSLIDSEPEGYVVQMGH